MRNIYLELPETESLCHNTVIATVTATTGSTPQKPGSSAIFKNGRLISGTVGGGVVEGKVQEAAKDSSLSHNSQMLHFTLDSNISEKDKAICGGEISILMDADPKIHLPVFREIKESGQRREAGVLITRISKSTHDIVRIERHWMTHSNSHLLPDRFKKTIEQEAKRILSGGNREGFLTLDAGLPEEDTSSVFCFEPVFPLPRLIIAGAGHIGKALSHIAKLLDFEVTVIDDRDEFANPVNLPDADRIIVRDIGTAMAEAEKSADTYVVIVTRGHSRDAEALKPCIGSGAAYIGMIGSKSKIAMMKADFIGKNRATEEQWAAIHSPIGLDIKSKTVEEIAISIAAELIKVRNENKLTINREP